MSIARERERRSSLARRKKERVQEKKQGRMEERRRRLELCFIFKPGFALFEFSKVISCYFQLHFYAIILLRHAYTS